MVITKFRGHVSFVLERASVYLELAENTFARMQKSAVDKLKAVHQRSESDLQRLRARSRGSFFVANEVFIRLGSQASSASRKAAVQLRRAHQAATTFGRASVDKVQKLRHESENDLRELQAGYRAAIIAIDTKIAQFGRQVSSLSRQVTRKLLKAQDGIVTLGRTIADKPRRMREVRLTRENDLRNLLASS